MITKGHEGKIEKLTVERDRKGGRKNFSITVKQKSELRKKEKEERGKEKCR